MRVRTSLCRNSARANPSDYPRRYRRNEEMYYAHRGMTSRPYKPDRPKLGVLPARLLIIDSALQTLYRRYAMRRNRGRVSRYRASFANAHISEKNGAIRITTPGHIRAALSSTNIPIPAKPRRSSMYKRNRYFRPNAASRPKDFIGDVAGPVRIPTSSGARFDSFRWG